MSRPRKVTKEERIEAAKAFAEGMRVRVVRSVYTNTYLEKDNTGTVAPRGDWIPKDLVEVWMDDDPHPREDSWSYYPDELEVIK